MIEPLAAYLAAAIYSFVCLSLGAFLTSLLAGKGSGGQTSHPLARLAAAFLLGQGVLAALWEVIALLGAFSSAVVVLVCVLASATGLQGAGQMATGLRSAARDALRWIRSESAGWKLVVMLTIVLGGIMGLAAYLPPQPRGDALAFYMVLPKVVAYSQRLSPLPNYRDFTAVGLQGELHYAALMVLSGATAAKLFVWPIAVSAAAVVAGIVAQAGGGRRGEWIAVAGLFSSSAFTQLAWDGKVDLFAAATGLAALFWAVQSRLADDPGRAAAMSGALTGLAIVGKISYIIVLPAQCIFLLAWARINPDVQKPESRRRGWRKHLRTMGVYSLAAAIALAPNILKNAWLFGAPLAPLGGGAWTGITQQSWFTAATTQKIVLTYPFALVFGRFWGQGGNISPLFLAFAPLAFYIPWRMDGRSSSLAPLALAGLGGIVLWLLYRPSVFAPRYILSSVILLPAVTAVFAASAATRDQGRHSPLPLTIPLAVVLALLFSIGSFRHILPSAARLVLNHVSPCDIEIGQSDASCRISRIINDEASPADRVFLASYYAYWLDAPRIQCINTQDEADTMIHEARPDAAWTYFFDRGFRYLVVDRLTHGQILAALPADQVPGWMHVTALYDDEVFIAYRIASKDGGRESVFSCSQRTPHAWQVDSVGAP